ncbi:MAG TPA: HAMP domain-containing sensor histidine kinase [Rhodocyclaceae bacterium]|nr:HAMP domain-containing sensor histidine kinase [Rhodocyclaceae bacterium]
MATLASYRLRLVFRGAFLLLAFAAVAMAVYVLQEERQRSYRNYRDSILKTKEQIVAKLRHPSGQLALLNPPRQDDKITPLRPVLLPYAAIDFDDQTKVRNAIEMAGCLVRYPRNGSLCVAIGNNPWAGGFIYAAGTFLSTALTPHRIGDQSLSQAHRLRVGVSLRGQSYRWIAPFEALGNANLAKNRGERGRLTGFIDSGNDDYSGMRPLKDFRGWIWQDAECATESTADGCLKKSFFSLRLPVEVLRDALFENQRPVWPPADLDQILVHIEALAPGESAPLFDSNDDKALPPFSLADLQPLLLPGESLDIRKISASVERDMLRLQGAADADASSPLIKRLIRRLPLESEIRPIELDDAIATPMGNYRIVLRGDARSIDSGLAATATRLSWFVGAMLLAIACAWLVLEIGIIRRIARLTRRATQLSRMVNDADGLEHVDFADLRGADEFGILANCLNELLRRVKEDVEREKIRAEQEMDMWRAVGHEIMSPLQSLMALHRDPADPSNRYINRMQQAIRILYGSASPGEAFQSSTLQIRTLDIDEFLKNVADNAACVGIDNVRFDHGDGPVTVRADDYSLEDVVTHVLRNADRYRTPGTPIVMRLQCSETLAAVTIRNVGPAIPAELIDTIFEYGVSDQQDAAANGNRGQGLFVAKTYMAKMGGTIGAKNVEDGVCFTLCLQRTAGGSD